MRRTLGVLRLAALAVAGLVVLGTPLPAQAAASGPNVIAPVGTVQAMLVTPKTHGKSADHRSAPLGNRWFYGAVAFNGNFTNNYLLFGWSKTADPSDLANGWCRYASPTGAIIADYPKLGHDANFVTFGDNQYDGSKSGLPFVTADIWAIPKPAASATTCSSSVTASHFADATHILKNSDGTGAFTPVPANTTDAFANGYIVAAHDVSITPQSKVMVWQMTPGPKLVAKGDISVGASYSIPAGVPQPGVPYLIDSLDGRLTQAVAHNDPSAGAEAVWTQQTVAGSGGRTIVRWYA